MNNFALGRYVPLQSCIHNLDPRSKLFVLICVMVSIFIPAGWTGYLILGIVILALAQLAKLSFSYVWKSMKPMLYMLLFLFVINVFIIRSGEVIFEIFNWKIYSDAIFQTLYIVVRLLLMVTMTTIVTATTKPLDLTMAIEEFLKPLKRFHVPAHEIAMMISISLRFIPTLIEETQRVMKAQASRGLDLEEGSLKEKIMGMLALIVPLFVSAFQHAEGLADAMEARGYVPSKSRTRYKQLKMRKDDYVLMGIIGIVIVILCGVAFL